MVLKINELETDEKQESFKPRLDLLFWLDHEGFLLFTKTLGLEKRFETAFLFLYSSLPFHFLWIIRKRALQSRVPVAFKILWTVSNRFPEPGFQVHCETDVGLGIKNRIP